MHWGSMERSEPEKLCFIRDWRLGSLNWLRPNKGLKTKQTGSTTDGEVVLLFGGRWEGVNPPVSLCCLIGVLLMLCDCSHCSKNTLWK